MSAIDDVLLANSRYAEQFTMGHLPVPPRKQLAIVTCMDARMDMLAILGMEPGDAHIIRNAGGIVTDDMIRSLIISHHLLATREFMVINHTECGMAAFRDEELVERLRAKTGAEPDSPIAFGTFADVQENVREQMRKVREHPWLPQVTVRGFVYDVRTGRLQEVYDE